MLFIILFMLSYVREYKYVSFTELLPFDYSSIKQKF